MRKWQLILSTIILMICATVVAVIQAYKAFLETPLITKVPVNYVLVPGTSVRTFAVDLQKKGLLNKPLFLVVLAYSKNIEKHLKAGEYLFIPGMTPAQVLDQMAAGKVVQHKFTIVEGWTFNQLLVALNKEPLLNHTLATETPALIAAKLKLSAINPEGWFFPATYNFTMGSTDIALLTQAHQLMTTKLNSAWEKRATDAPYKTLYDALIAASLVEKESAQPKERPMIAGVLVKRLQLNMPLQIDSTVIYGLGNAYTGKIHSADLKQDTPYNTYTRKGLPPTPIAMPSADSIQAALHPIVTDALYFVAKGDGTHQFSSNLNEHNHAVTSYQIDIVLPNVGKKAEKMKCPQFWYIPDSLQPLFSIDCQIQK